MSAQEVGLVTLQTIVLTVMLFGLFSLLVPVIPGLVIIWVAALVYGIITGFTWVSAVLMVLITLLMAFGSIVDNLIMGASARQQGASWLSLGTATLAGVAGSIFFPPFGGFIAALLGIFIVEFIRARNWRQAFKSTRSMAAGCGWSVLVRFALGALMVFIWVGWAALLPVR